MGCDPGEVRTDVREVEAGSETLREKGTNSGERRERIRRGRRERIRRGRRERISKRSNEHNGD
jgi:hypothetical protein